MSFSVMLCTIGIYIQFVNDNAGSGKKVLDGAETITAPHTPSLLPDSKLVKEKNVPSLVTTEVRNSR